MSVSLSSAERRAGPEARLTHQDPVLAESELRWKPSVLGPQTLLQPSSVMEPGAHQPSSPSMEGSSAAAAKLLQIVSPLYAAP